MYLSLSEAGKYMTNYTPGWFIKYLISIPEPTQQPADLQKSDMNY